MQVYNNKNIKTIARTSPVYWFNKLSEGSDSERDEKVVVKHEPLSADVELILPNEGKGLEYRNIDLKIDNISLDELNNEYIRDIVDKKYGANWAQFCFYIIVQFKTFSEQLKKNCLYLEQNSKYAKETLAEVKESKKNIEMDRAEIKKQYEVIKVL